MWKVWNENQQYTVKKRTVNNKNMKQREKEQGIETTQILKSVDFF